MSGSRDGSIQIMDSVNLETFARGRLSTGVTATCISPFDESILISGSVTGDILVWNIPTMKPLDASDKKKKRAARSVEEILPKTTIASLTKTSITGIQWINATQVVVSSLDGMIQVVHPLEDKNFPGVATGRAISALAVLDETRIATGHPDGRVIFWNIRLGTDAATLEAISACRSHTRMVSALAARPGSNEIVASASIDGSVKLFDVRASSFAVQSVSLPEDVRGLAVAWNGSECLLSGASDGVVRTHVIA